MLRLGTLNFRAIIAALLLRFGRLNFRALIAALLLRFGRLNFRALFAKTGRIGAWRGWLSFRFFDLNFRAQGAGCARARLSPAETGRNSARRGWLLFRFFDLNFRAKIDSNSRILLLEMK